MLRDTADTSELPLTDPPPRFPSVAELELAERLRRKIEERYLGTPAVPPALARAA